MKKVTGLALCLLLILLCAAALADVTIDAETFPDAAFRRFVSLYLDPDENGKLSDAEISNVKEIECMDFGIADLTGIGVFKNLTYLNCWKNCLTGLDLSQNTKLNYLMCNCNLLKKLDVSPCPELCRAVSKYERTYWDGCDIFGTAETEGSVTTTSLPFLAVDCTTTVKAGSITSKPSTKRHTIAEGSLSDTIFYKMDNLGRLTIYGEGELPSFCGCEPPFISFNVQETIIEEGITYLGDQLKQCNTRTVSLPDSLVTIDTWAFRGCNYLTELTIPDGVTTIRDSAFLNARSLKSLYIGRSVSSIEHRCFYGCDKLTDITVSPENQHLRYEDGLLYCDNTLTNCLPWKTGKVVIPEGITYITYSVFEDNAGITDVTLPGTLEYIDEEAFLNCTGLRDIVLPDGLSHLSAKVFDGCTGLQEVVIPDSVTYVGGMLFNDCSGLKSVVLPRNLQKVYVGLFSGCKSLPSVTLPDAVTEIQYSAFSDCSSLKSIYLPAGVTEIDSSAFSNCTRLKHVWYGGTKADRAGIKIDTDNVALKNAVWHYEAAAIGEAEDDPEEDTVTVAGGIYELDRDNLTAALAGLSDPKAKELKIPATIKAGGSTYKVTAVKASACKNKKNLATLVIGKNIASIGKYAFSGCKKLKAVTIKTSLLTVKTIGKNAFKNIHKNAVIKCPKKVLELYRTILPQKGVPSTATITK